MSLSPTPYAPGNIDQIIDALSPQGLVELCNAFLHYEVDDETGIKQLRATLREGFERELIRGAAIVEVHEDEQDALADDAAQRVA